MATVSYEVLTKVKKTYYGKSLRAYTFEARILISDMTAHNFAQLKMPYSGGKSANISIVGHIPAKKPKTATALKSAITKKMKAEKAKYEKLLRPVPTDRQAVTLKAGGNYKDIMKL